MISYWAKPYDARAFASTAIRFFSYSGSGTPGSLAWTATSRPEGKALKSFNGPVEREESLASSLAALRSEAWREALLALHANKLRAFLTMLGVVIGSACIVLVVTVALTGKYYVTQQIQGIGSNLVYAELLRGGARQPATLEDELSLGDMKAIRQEIPQVVEVAGTHDIPLALAVGGAVRPITLVGVTQGFQHIRNLLILRGRYFDPGDMEERSKVCLLTEHLADVAFPNQDPIGKALRLGSLPFTVIGVFRERVATFGQSEIQRDSAIVPFPVLDYFTGTNFLGVIYAQAATAQDVPLVTRRAAEILKARHRPGARYNVQNLRPLLEAAQRISEALTIVLLLIAMFSLAVSGIGIMNIMLVTVTERTREIGIRMAVGARRREIRWQFLIEAILISGVGAIVGIAIAAGLPLAIQPWLPGNLTIPVSWLSVVVAFAAACLTGVVFGYLPANRAAKLQPIESLRHE
jgi:putative ABC transport system permease protein